MTIADLMEDGSKVRVGTIVLPLSLGNKIRMVSQQVLTEGAKESEVSTHCLILLNGIIN